MQNLSQNEFNQIAETLGLSGDGLVQIAKIRIINTFTARGFSETSPVMHLNKHIFRNQ